MRCCDVARCAQARARLHGDAPVGLLERHDEADGKGAARTTAGNTVAVGAAVRLGRALLTTRRSDIIHVLAVVTGAPRDNMGYLSDSYSFYVSAAYSHYPLHFSRCGSCVTLLGSVQRGSVRTLPPPRVFDPDPAAAQVEECYPDTKIYCWRTAPKVATNDRSHHFFQKRPHVVAALNQMARYMAKKRGWCILDMEMMLQVGSGPGERSCGATRRPWCGRGD